MKSKTTIGITREQVKAAYARNARQLQEMADKAKSIAASSGKKYRGYTADELYAKAAEYRRKLK